MRRLILMRHGKAEPASGGGDHGRPLSRRGCAEAAEAGARLAALARPDIALESDSTRTRQTTDHVLPSFDPQPSRRTTPALYGAPAEAMLRVIRAAPDDARTLLIVGHNPGTGDLARRLAPHGDAEALNRLAAGFPTSCFALISFEAGRWAELDGGGRLEFLLPADDRSGR